MKKLGLGAVLMLLSGFASATQYAANGVIIAQVPGGTVLNVVAVHQDGFNSEYLCEDFILDQQAMALLMTKTPDGRDMKVRVNASCSQTKQHGPQ